MSYTVENIGTRATRGGSFTDRFFLSLDPSLDSKDLFIGERAGQALGIGESYTETVTLSLPEGVEGQFYIIGYTDSAADRDRTGLGPPSEIGFNQPGTTFEFLSKFVPFDMVDLTRREFYPP